MITSIVTQPRFVHILKFIEADRLKTSEASFLEFCSEFIIKVGKLGSENSERLEKLFYETQWRDKHEIED